MCPYFFLCLNQTPQVCFVCHTLFALVFRKLCACDNTSSLCWRTNMSVFLLALSCGSGTYGVRPGHQCLPVWMGRLSPAAGAGTEEEGDGLVQENNKPTGDQTRHGAAATETIRPHR